MTSSDSSNGRAEPTDRLVPGAESPESPEASDSAAGGGPPGGSPGGGPRDGSPDPLADVVADTGGDVSTAGRAGDDGLADAGDQGAAGAAGGEGGPGGPGGPSGPGGEGGAGAGTGAGRGGAGAGRGASSRVRRFGGRPIPTTDLAAEMAEAAADLAAADAAAEVEVDLGMAAVARERDEYLDALRRLQADFENYKKRVEKQKIEHVERAAGDLVSKLLPVCDTVDLAIAHGGGEEVKQVWTAMFDALEREGLERIDPVGEPFDPTVHDAVAHEPGDGSGGFEVVEVMRAGYRWKGRVLRPAMVKVKG